MRSGRWSARSAESAVTGIVCDFTSSNIGEGEFILCVQSIEMAQ